MSQLETPPLVAESRIPQGAWLLCWLLFCASALSFLDRQVLSILQADETPAGLSADLQMNNTVYSRVVFCFTLSYAIMFSLGGWLVDRLGTRLGMGLSVLIWSIASAAHALVRTPWQLGGARFLLGMGEGACFPAASKGACEWFPASRRALAIGIANGGSALGMVIAPPLTAIVAGHYGWRGVFVATGILGAAWLIAWCAAPSVPPLASLAPVPSPAPGTPSRTSRLELLRQPRIWRFLAARFLFDPVFYFFMFWIPKYLSKERGLAQKEIGALLWIPFLALGVSNLAAGWISDHLVRRGVEKRRARLTLLTIAACIMPVSGLVVFVPSAGWAIALMALLLAAHGQWICNYLARIGDEFPAADMATVVGLTGTCGAVAGMISTLTIGPMADHHGFLPAFVVMAVLYPAALLVLVSGRKTPALTGQPI